MAVAAIFNFDKIAITSTRINIFDSKIL